MNSPAAQPQAFSRSPGVRGFLVLLACALVVIAIIAALPSTQASAAGSPYVLGDRFGNPNPTAGDGTAANPFMYEVVIDCTASPGTNGAVDLASGSGVVGSWYRVVIDVVTGGSCVANYDYQMLSTGAQSSATLSGTTVTDLATDDAAAIAFRLEPDGTLPQGMTFKAGIFVEWGTGASGGRVNFHISGTVPGSSPSPSSPSSSSSAPDPRAASVAVVAEQVAAAGVEGSSGGVRVRGSEVLPVTSRVSGAVGPRGGVVLDSDGMQVRVASVLGARADAGVIVPSSGVFEASVTGPLVPGSVVEVWINSEPRLVAAAEVPEDGDSVTVAIPTGTPLDGGDPIEDGEHTLELRLYTEDGYEIVATGITVGQVAPTSIPAGEGPVPLGGVLPLLAGALLLGAVAGRRVFARG